MKNLFAAGFLGLACGVLTAVSASAESVTYLRTKVDANFANNGYNDNVVLTERVGIAGANYYAELGAGALLFGSNDEAALVAELGLNKFVSDNTLLSVIVEPMYLTESDTFQTNVEGNIVIFLD